VDHSRKGGRLLVSLQNELNVKVFVINQHGLPLMPTTPRKARLLCEVGKAKRVSRTPHTIQLLYGSSGYKQPVTVGIDAGYKTVGFSAVTDKGELLSGELTLLKGMSERLKERAMYRQGRRYQKQKRYRQARFDNRKKPNGWLAPSILHKLNSHLRLVKKIKAILPVTQVVVEVANFDIQAIKSPGITRSEYQEGEQAGFWNLREYILHRDNHECQNLDCRNRAEEKRLQVHHLGYWKQDRSDRPANLITLCTKCHMPANHKPSGFLHGWQPKIKSFRPETFMSTVRWQMVNDIGGVSTYGYLTKSGRIALGLPKTHYQDAFVIAGGAQQVRADPMLMEQRRRNNRSLQKFYDARYLDTRSGEKAHGQELNSGRRTRNKNLNGENLRVYRGVKVSNGRVSIRRRRYACQSGSLVRYKGQIYMAKGIQNHGDYIKLAGLPKPIKTSLISLICSRKGICQIWIAKRSNDVT
jgi:hypothetical protein